MQWTVILHPEFDKWLKELDINNIKDSKLSNLKELRVRSTGEPIRVLFAFDPWTEGVLLVGGNKAGDSKWYKKNIAIAEQRFNEHVDRHKRLLKEQQEKENERKNT